MQASAKDKEELEKDKEKQKKDETEKMPAHDMEGSEESQLTHVEGGLAASLPKIVKGIFIRKLVMHCLCHQVCSARVAGLRANYYRIPWPSGM